MNDTIAKTSSDLTNMREELGNLRVKRMCLEDKTVPISQRIRELLPEINKLEHELTKLRVAAKVEDQR